MKDDVDDFYSQNKRVRIVLEQDYYFPKYMNDDDIRSWFTGPNGLNGHHAARDFGRGPKTLKCLRFKPWTEKEYPNGETDKQITMEQQNDK